MKVKEFYALIDNKMNFSIVAKTENELDEKIERAYILRSGLKAKGSEYTKADFLKERSKAHVVMNIMD